MMLFSSDCFRAQTCNVENLDHLLIFVSDSRLEDSLSTLFTPGEKLRTKHPKQGTQSSFFLFYNTYIELIYLADSALAKQNGKNFGSDYPKRWGDSDSICCFGFGTIRPLSDSSCKNVHVYNSPDGPSTYLMWKWNSNSEDAFIYASGLNHQYHVINSPEDLKRFHSSPFLEDFQNYVSHPTAVKRLTRVVVSGPDSNNKPNLVELADLEEVELKEAPSFHILLEFDTGRQNKTFNPQPWITIKY